MPQNPVTDKTLGTRSKNWSEESYKSVRKSVGLSTDEPRHKGKRKHAPKLIWSDFELGDRVLCYTIDSKGLRCDYVGRVVDVHDASSSFNQVGTVMVVLEAADHKSGQKWLGHLHPLTFHNKSRWHFISWRGELHYKPGDVANFCGV